MPTLGKKKGGQGPVLRCLPVTCPVLMSRPALSSHNYLNCAETFLHRLGVVYIPPLLFQVWPLYSLFINFMPAKRTH